MAESSQSEQCGGEKQGSIVLNHNLKPFPLHDIDSILNAMLAKVEAAAAVGDLATAEAIAGQLTQVQRTVAGTLA